MRRLSNREAFAIHDRFRSFAPTNGDAVPLRVKAALAPLRGFGLDPYRTRHQEAWKGKWVGVGLRPQLPSENQVQTQADGLACRAAAGTIEVAGAGKMAITAHVRVWRNGRRAGLKILFRKECRFESDHPHHFLFLTS